MDERTDLVHFYYALRRSMLNESVSANDQRVNDGDGAVTRAVTWLRTFLRPQFAAALFTS